MESAFIVKRTDSGEYITNQGVSAWAGKLINASLLTDEQAIEWEQWAKKRDIPVKIVHVEV